MIARVPLMICPQCGYERKKSDEIIKTTECPKCSIIYSKWKAVPFGEGKQSAPDRSEKPSIETEVIRKKPIERLVIYTIAVVILIILLHSFIVPVLIRLFQSTKNDVRTVVNIDLSTKSPSRFSDKKQTESSETKHASENVVSRKELSIADIIRANRESIVVVKTAAGIGSGFFINRDGYIVTNKHVLPNPGRAEIKTVNGTVFKIHKVIHEDSDADLVIASTDAPPQESKPVNINAGLPEAGEKIIVIGNPLGLEQTVSDGIVSAVRQNNKAVDFIQITAPVSAGNSGGPLLNMRGEVIGVATFQYRSGQNLNFCVSASRIVGLQQGSLSYSARSSGFDLQSPQVRDVYCYADANGQVSFVEWRTGMQISRPDGTLDRVKYEKWVVEQVGGNPDAINPEKEARDDVEKNREQLFKSVFPHRSLSDTNLTGAEKEWLERRYQRHYVESYNQWMARRNDAIRKYNSMMNEFGRFIASRR